MVPGPEGIGAMSDETLYAFEQTQSRGDIAADLRFLAAQLDGDGAVTFAGDDQTVAVTPSERPAFEIEVERDQSDDAETSEMSIELEIEWPESAADEPPAASATISTDEEATTAVDLDAEAVESRGRFHVYRDRANEWRWRLVHYNGNIIATSGEGYSSRRNAEKGLQSVMKNAPGAETLLDE
jgi:amphi-Trp domain-containing protein